MTARWPRPAALGDPRTPYLVVEASAGTGKTYFLEHRVIDLLLTGDEAAPPATIDQIVVVTYTEKATAELRLRIRRLLTAMVWDAPPDDVAGDGWLLDDAARARLRAALELVDAAPISTIHGFCQRVLTEESFAAGRAFEQQAVPDEVALHDAFLDALRERFAVVPEDRALLRAYLEDKKVTDLFKDVLALYRFGVPLPEHGRGAHQALIARVHDEVVQRAEQQKRRGGQVDFHDMLRLTARALEADAALARRVATRFPWALVDEFQDTDPIQWQICARIWRHPPARGLTIVGDPKQAIYSFRGGDVDTYLQATRELLDAGAARATLDVCQRSTGDVVGTINRVLARPRSLFAGSNITYDTPVRASGEVHATWPDGRPVAPIACLRLDQIVIDPLRAEPVRDLIAEATADEIARLVGDPAHRITGTVRGRPHVIGPGDIFVLTRTNDESLAAAAAIRRRGVPCAFHQAEHLFGTQEAEDVAALLAAIARPRDRTAQLRAWMTCFFDVDADQLARARDVADDHPLASRFHDWRGAAARMDYPRLFRSILDDTRVVERALAVGGGARTVTNLAHVLEYLHAEIERSRCELPALVSRLRAQINDATTLRPDESDVQRRETDQPAVQIMTVHRAKGLEAWVVFLSGGVGFSKRQADPVQVVHEGGQRVAVLKGSDVIVQTQEHENQRLAYVALTRARARLYVPVLPSKASKSAAKRPKSSSAPVEHGWHSIYGALHDALTELANAPAPLRAPVPAGANVIAFPSKQIELAVDAWPVSREPEGVLDVAAVALPPPPPPPLEPAALGRRAGFVVTSYSRLRRDAAELDVAAVTADERSKRSPAEGDLPGGAATGQLLHAVLERADFAAAAAQPLAAWRARDEVGALFERAERTFGVDRRHRPPAAALVHATITAPIEAVGPGGTIALPSLAAAPRLAREVEFVYPIPDPPLPAGAPGSRGFVKGYIDAIVAWDARWFVVDYKSDVLDDDLDAIRRHTEEHYALQAELYAIAAARMLRVDGAADFAARFGGLLYYFLRPGRVIHLAPSWDDLGRYTGALAVRDYA